MARFGDLCVKYVGVLWELRVYYGWIVVAGVFVSQLFVTGFYTYGFSLLVVPIQTDLGVTRAEIMYGFSGATLAGLVWSPIVGALVDRWSIRGLMAIGAALFATSLWLMGQSQNLWQFVAVFSVGISLSMALLGAVTGTALVSRWFTARRGQALGISAIGTSVGGIVIPMLIEHWASSGDWRATLVNFSLMVWLLLLPVILLSLRDRRDDEYEPNTDAATVAHGESTNVAAHDQADWTFSAIVRNRNYWSLGLCLGLLFSSQTAVMTNLPAYAVGLGVSAADAARLVMLIAFTGMIGHDGSLA